MPAFETDADLAGMFDPGDFAVSASYSTGGAPVAVSVIQDVPGDDIAGLGDPGAEGSQLSALIRTIDIPGGVAAPGHVLTIAGTAYPVESARPDATRAVWRLVLSDPA